MVSYLPLKVVIQDGVKSFVKKISEQPISETLRETLKLLNYSKKQSFQLENKFCWIRHGKKLGGINLPHPPTSTLNLRSQNHSRVCSKFTYLHNNSDVPCDGHITLASISSHGSFTLKMSPTHQRELY